MNNQIKKLLEVTQDEIDNKKQDAFGYQYSKGFQMGLKAASTLYEAQLKAAKAREDRLVEALVFYENTSRLMIDVRDIPKGSSFKTISYMDNGDRAREALSFYREDLSEGTEK